MSFVLTCPEDQVGGVYLIFKCSEICFLRVIMEKEQKRTNNLDFLLKMSSWD